MTIHHHPSLALLLSYASGAASEAEAIAVSAHMTYCATCRNAVEQAEAIGGTLLDGVEQSSLLQSDRREILALLDRKLPESASARPSGRQSLPGATDALPSVLNHYVGSALAAGDWRMIAPGIKQLPLVTKGRGRARLLKINPGTAIPKHTHGGVELTVLLSGSYTDELGQFLVGDMAEHDETITHRPIVDQGEVCTALIVTDRPLKFSGWLARLAQPIIGI